MNDLTRQLLDMKKKIDDAKDEANQIRGQITQLEKQRIEEFGCVTADEADEYLVELEQQINQLEDEIKTGVSEVKEELGW